MNKKTLQEFIEETIVEGFEHMGTKWDETRLSNYVKAINRNLIDNYGISMFTSELNMKNVIKVMKVVKGMQQQITVN